MNMWNDDQRTIGQQNLILMNLKKACLMMTTKGDARTKIETVFYGALQDRSVSQILEFQVLTEHEAKKIILAVQNECKKYVVGAMYDDFSCNFYGFSNKEGCIWLSDVYYAFLKKYKLEIEQLNYYAWARSLEQINGDDVACRVLEKLELATPKRQDLSIYRELLWQEFEVNNCFYCGRRFAGTIHVDHVIPWQLVREDRLWNFVLACQRCNTKKNNRLLKVEKFALVLERNEQMLTNTRCRQDFASEFKNYYKDMMWELWDYAQMSGFREWGC